MKRNFFDKLFGLVWLTDDGEFIVSNWFTNFLCRMAVKQKNFKITRKWQSMRTAKEYNVYQLYNHH